MVFVLEKMLFTTLICCVIFIERSCMRQAETNETSKRRRHQSTFRFTYINVKSKKMKENTDSVLSYTHLESIQYRNHDDVSLA